jgi:hypothetical protein
MQLGQVFQDRTTPNFQNRANQAFNSPYCKNLQTESRVQKVLENCRGSRYGYLMEVRNVHDARAAYVH